MAANGRESIDFDRENERILAGLDIVAEYEALGVIFTTRRVRENGIVECYAAGREESRPSAGVNAKTGRYFDMGGSGESRSLWDFAAAYGNGRFADWRDARKHYAEKAGIPIGATIPAGRKNGKASGGSADDERLDSIRWLDWNPGREKLATMWGRIWKPGITLEALKLAGGRFGEFPIRKNKETGETYGGEYKIVGIPAFDSAKLNLSRPSCWVIWNVSGPHLLRHRGPDLEPEKLKMRTVGASRGTLMNRHAVERLASGSRPKLVIKTGGPTDMLAVLSALPPEWRELIYVTTNASGETGEVVTGQVELFAGIPVVCVGDRDYAGTVGVMRWLSSVSGERRAIRLPFDLRPSHGQDSRDFLNAKG